MHYPFRKYPGSIATTASKNCWGFALDACSLSSLCCHIKGYKFCMLCGHYFLVFTIDSLAMAAFSISLLPTMSRWNVTRDCWIHLPLWDAVSNTDAEDILSFDLFPSDWQTNLLAEIWFASGDQTVWETRRYPHWIASPGLGPNTSVFSEACDVCN